MKVGTVLIIFLPIFAIIGLFSFDNPVKCSFVDCLETSNINIINVNASALPADYTNIAYQNQSNNFTQLNNFTNINATNGNFSKIWAQWLNVSGNATIGNASIDYLNVTQQLFVGLNRSAFPFTCTGNQVLSALGTNGILTCSTPVSSTDYTNVAFLNNTQNFTAQNTFRDTIFLGWVNASNQTVWTVLNNVSSKGYINASGFNATSWSLFGNINASGFVNSTSFLMGTMCNASTFNATGNSIFGNINVSGYVNATSFVTGTMGNFSFMNASNTITSYYDNSTFQNATKNVTGSSIGVMMVNQTAAGYYPAVVFLFDNETEVSGTTVQWLNFTLPAANQFSRIIVKAQWTILGASATAYGWVIEMAVGGTIIHDQNITSSAITADTFRDEGTIIGGTATTTGKLTIKLYPVIAGSATVELQSLQVFAVS